MAVAPLTLPGDRRGESTAAMIRVDHAGEYGAARIYAGQLAVLGGRGPVAAEIGRMAAQEARHLAVFETLIARRGVRPTLLHPLWHVAGYALGAATALLGPRAAMACTVAVETEIDRHYQAQRDALGVSTDPELAAHIEDFQAEEVEHRETARAHGAENLPGYGLFARVVSAGCRAAIAVSTRL